MLAATVMLLSACDPRESFGTETREEWCLALIADAPSASINDKPQTLEEVADVNDTIETLCEDFL